MKRVLVLLLGAMLIASLSLAVSCKKQEEMGQSGEETMSTVEKAGEHLDKAAESGEKAMKETTEKAGGYGK